MVLLIRLCRMSCILFWLVKVLRLGGILLISWMFFSLVWDLNSWSVCVVFCCRCIEVGFNLIFFSWVSVYCRRLLSNVLRLVVFLLICLNICFKWFRLWFLRWKLMICVSCWKVLVFFLRLWVIMVNNWFLVWLSLVSFRFWVVIWCLFWRILWYSIFKMERSNNNMVMVARIWLCCLIVCWFFSFRNLFFVFVCFVLYWVWIFCIVVWFLVLERLLVMVVFFW